MMFGFGDDAAPLDESAELMEDLVVEYVHAMVGILLCCANSFLVVVR